jgi:hypothetical protein
MAILNFPDSPTGGAVFVAPNGVTYIYDASTTPGVWKATSSSNLVVTAGSISGTPTVGSTLNYTAGTASGGNPPYNYTQQWKANGVNISGATSTTYIVQSTDVGKYITVTISASDSTVPTALTGSATTAATVPVSNPGIPTSVWNPGNAMNNSVPGTSSALWQGASGTVTSTDCAVISTDGSSWSQTANVTSGVTTLYVQWNLANPSTCGNAPSGTAISGTVVSAEGINTYNVTVERRPSLFGFAAGSTSAALGSLQTSNTVTISGSGMNAPAYVTLGSLTAGATGFEADINGNGFVAIPAAPSTSLVINPGETIQVRYTTGSTAGATFDGIVKIGDANGTLAIASNPGFIVTNTSSAALPTGVYNPTAGKPNATPAATNIVGESLNGTVSAAWDGTEASTVLTPETGKLLINKNGGVPGAAAVTLTNSGTDTVQVAFDPNYIATVNDTNTATATFTSTYLGVNYTNTFTYTVDKQPAWAVPAPVTGAGLSTQQTTGVLTPNNFNSPVTVSFANPTTAGSVVMANVGIEINGSGTVTPITVGTTTVTLNPGDFFEVFGDTGALNSQDYGLTITLGAASGQEWLVTTTAVTPSIDTPSIVSPTGSPPALLNPAVNTPAGITLIGDTYSPQNGASATQTSSTWEVYKGGYPLGPSTNTISTVTPGTAGAPSAVVYKNANTGDPNSALAQNVVYGEVPQNNALAAGQPAGTYPAFEWADALSINGFTDWYIPAKNELEILYYNLKPSTSSNFTSSGVNPNAVPPRGGNYTAGNPPPTSVTLFQSGNAEAFESGGSGYWSASENSTVTYAWYQNFDVGFQVSVGNKNSSNVYARVIRRIPIAEYTAAGSPAIGSYLKGGFYGGQISTAGNGTADYALIVAPNAQGTFGYTGGTNASLTIAGANTDGFQVGMTIKGAPSNATGIILSINATTIQYLPTSGTFAFGDTISTDPASYTALTGSPYTGTVQAGAADPEVLVPQADLAVSSTYYARVQYATTNASVATSAFSNWSSFATAASFLPSPGAAYGGGYFAGQINDGGTIYNLIVAPVTSGALNGALTTFTALAYKTALSGPDTDAQSVVYGAPAMLANNTATWPVFNWCKNNATGPNAGNYDATNAAGTGIGGYNDWYIPAKNELEILYRNLKPTSAANVTSGGANPNAVPPTSNYTSGNPTQITNPLFQAGGAQAFTSTGGNTWSATEFSGDTRYAWVQVFSDGTQSPDAKTNNASARAIRRVAA